MRRAVSILVSLVALTAPVIAEDKPHWVAHGQEITAAKVGPEAIGFKTLESFGGDVIADRRDYPFAKWIDQAATYDGFDVPAGHLLIEGVAFSSSLDISAPFPVVLRGVSVRLSQASPWGILMRPGSGGVFVLWSEVRGAAFPVDVALDLRGSPARAYHSHFLHTTDGIHVSGPGDVRIEQNLIEDLVAVKDSHNDGIQLLGAPRDVRILKNKIVNPNRQTSCVYLLGRDLEVRSNALAGGGWTVYAGGRNNGHGGNAGGPVVLKDNIFDRRIFSKGGYFGPVAYWNPEWTASDNRFEDGAAIKP